MRKTISFIILTAFFIGCVNPPQGFAQTLTAVGLMPQPGVSAALTAPYTPACLKGMTMDLQDPFRFDFMVARGDEHLTPAQKRAEYPKLIKYFLAALAVPDTDQWVNLSPYEQDRIIPDSFGLTEMGRDLLAQDYLLKQLSASLTNPDTDLGRKFWDGVYARAYEKFGTTDIPTDTFNKVWITPDKAVIYEKGLSVYVLENHLKVQMESDYLAMKKNGVGELPDSRDVEAPAAISVQVMREIIIPVLEKEVNEGENFAPLRQVYSGMLLATWYKRTLQESILSRLYADKEKVQGIDQDPRNNQKIYDEYVQAFKQGVFNMIREDVDMYSQEPVARKYFSGGINGYAGKKLDHAQENEAAADMAGNVGDADRVSVRVRNFQTDDGMVQGLSDRDLPRIIEMEIVRNFLLKNPELYPDIAKKQDDAYSLSHNYDIDPTPWTMEKNGKQIYRNMAGIFATLEGVALIAERDGRKIREVLQDVLADALSDTDRNMLARMAHATWLSTQFDYNFSTQRFLRPVVMPAQELKPSLVEDDLKQIRAAAGSLQAVITDVVKDQLDTEIVKGVQERVENLISLIRARTPLSEKDESRIRKTALTVFYAHREQKRAQGTPYVEHPVGVAEIAFRLFGDTRPFMKQPALFAVGALMHDVREDQDEFFEQFRNFSRNVILQDKTVSGQEKMARFNQVLLIVRMLSKLTPGEDGQGSEEELTRKTYEMLANPRDFFSRAGMPAYDDDFIRAVQLIKLSDIIYNTGDLITLIGLADSPQKEQEARIKIEKSFDKILRFSVPFFVMKSAYLEKSDVEIFFREMLDILDKYKTNTDEKYAFLAGAAAKTGDALRIFEKEYHDRAQSQGNIRQVVMDIKKRIAKLSGYMAPFNVAKALGTDISPNDQTLGKVLQSGAPVITEQDVATALVGAGFDEEKAPLVAHNLVLGFERDGYSHDIAVAAARVLVQKAAADISLPYAFSLIAGFSLIGEPAALISWMTASGDFSYALKTIIDPYILAMFAAGAGFLKLSQRVKLWHRQAIVRNLKAFADKNVDRSQDNTPAMENIFESNTRADISKLNRDIYEMERRFQERPEQERKTATDGEAIGRMLMMRARAHLHLKQFPEAMEDYRLAHSGYKVSPEDQESFSQDWQKYNGGSVDTATSDHAAVNGGIDMNSSSLDMQIRRDGSGVPLPVSQQDLDNMHISGLIPEILDIQPATLSMFSRN